MDIIYLNKLIKELLKRLKNPNESLKDILVTSLVLTNVFSRLTNDESEKNELSKIIKELDKCNKLLLNLSDYIIIE